MFSKSSLPKKIVKEIDLVSFLNSFAHLAKPQEHRMKGVDSELIRMSHSGMSFGEYYEHLKSYSGIADVKVKPARKRLFGAENPLTVTIFDRIQRDIYLRERLDSSKIRALISAYYTLTSPKTVERIIKRIPDGQYIIDRKLSLRKGQKFERRRYRHLYLYSTGEKVDLKNCMLFYRLRKDEIIKALKCGVWVREEGKEEVVVEQNGTAEILQDFEKRLLLKRFDIYFTIQNLYRIVLKKAEEKIEHPTWNRPQNVPTPTPHPEERTHEESGVTNGTNGDISRE